MEFCKPLHDRQRARALTPLLLLRGVVCLMLLLSTAFAMLVFGGFMTAVILRLISIHHSRKMTSVIFGAWLALWPFLFEKINKTQLFFSGECVPDKERVLLIANHRTEVDWMYLWDLALRKGSLGYVKYVLKSSLMKIPVFGWAFHILEFIPVERKWEVDGPILYKMLSTLKEPRDPLWLALFPEGTDFTERKCVRSQKYAAENGLPVLKNVLLPKTKGFLACVVELRDSLDAVYDVTIGYKPRCPCFLDNVFGVNPTEVHMHIRRISLLDIPTSEAGITAWLSDAFCLKDKLLTEFHSTGHFPGQRSETDLSMVQCLVNCTAVMMVTSLCIYLTLFSDFWFKMYVGFACIYLASATAYDIRPLPLFRFLKSPSTVVASNSKQALE